MSEKLQELLLEQRPETRRQRPVHFVRGSRQGCPRPGKSLGKAT